MRRTLNIKCWQMDRPKRSAGRLSFCYKYNSLVFTVALRLTCPRPDSCVSVGSYSLGSGRVSGREGALAISFQLYELYSINLDLTVQPVVHLQLPDDSELFVKY